MLDINITAKVQIDGILYDQVETIDVNEGDLVLDLKDGTYGYVDMKKGDSIAVKDHYAVELGVPISRVRKLIPSLVNNSLN